MNRRHFLAAGLGALGSTLVGAHPLARALTLPPTTLLTSSYGPLLEPDANGLRLPDGFTSRVIATSGQPIGSYIWHPAPDGGACFATDDGGWVYVSNSEIPVAGGVGAVRFASDGEVADAYRILLGTSLNCAGGPTPWGTWLTCEEHDAGLVWECDPLGVVIGTPLPALGTFKHEAAAVDLDRGHVFLTEDQGDGCFYRFVSAGRSGDRLDLSSGALEVASWDELTGAVTWHEVPNPNVVGGTAATRAQVAAATHFAGGEGAWFHDGHVYWTTKGEGRVYDYDCASSTMTVLYDDSASAAPILTGVDNVTVTSDGRILVAEDGGDMQVCMLTRDLSGEYAVAPIVQIVGHEGSEVTGPAFSPDGTRLYFSSQRGARTRDLGLPSEGEKADNSWEGVTYEVTGPF